MRATRARLALAGLSTVAVVAAAATPQLLGSHVGTAFERLDDARRAWLWAAAVLVLVPASLLPLTPGNIGIASGAVIVAQHGYGIDAETALTISLGLHAVEAVVAVVFGAVGLVAVAGERRSAAERAVSLS